MILKQIQNIILKIKFFNKILLIYAIILILMTFILSIIISKNVTSELLQNEKKLNKQILAKVNNYLGQNYELSKKILYYLYLDKFNYQAVIDFLTITQESQEIDYHLSKQSFGNIFAAQVSREPSIFSILIYKNIDSSIYVYTKNYKTMPFEENFNSKNWSWRIDKDSFKSILLPAHDQYYTNYPSTGPDKVYTFISNIRENNSYKTLGSIMFDFSTKSIENAYKEYKTDLKGYIIILNQNGDVIYDSSNSYYDKKYPYYNTIINSSGNAIVEKKSVINIYKSDLPGVIVAGIIPESQVFSGINKINITIFIISFACIFIALILSYMSMKLFSKRVNSIILAMKSVRKGDLSVKLPLGKLDDEIGEIALSFNEMCEDLKNHINKVYISNIKQKNAELNALQSQINPHFLYNTLESIRMKAETEGKGDVSNMIYILAVLMRNMVKEEAIIDIRSEIKYCNLYLELFKIRYGNKLTIQFNIENSLLKYGILKYLLQPVIENYILHGFDILKNDNRIIINGYYKENEIYFEISDNGKGIADAELKAIRQRLESTVPEKLVNSIGLTNVNERIKIIYGDAYGLDITSKKGAGTAVKLKIQAKTIEELKVLCTKF